MINETYYQSAQQAIGITAFYLGQFNKQDADYSQEAFEKLERINDYLYVNRYR